MKSSSLRRMLICFAILSSLQSVSQENHPVSYPHPLKIGDKVPNIKISNIHNYKRSTEMMSAFKGKLVILDFWFGTCRACVEGFPKLEALQRTFGDSIQILLVDFEPQSKIDAALKSYRRISYIYKLPDLPSVTSDTLLHSLFSFRIYPHEVLIDGNGIVRAFASLADITEDYIRKILHGEAADIDQKYDNISFDAVHHSLLSQLFPEDNSSLLTYSSIFKFVPGLSGIFLHEAIDTVNKTVRISRFNMSIPDLLGEALYPGWGESLFESPKYDYGKRIQLLTADSSRYFYKEPGYSSRAAWQRKNCFGYESVLKLSDTSKMYSLMLTDLENYFNLSIRKEKRKFKCLALVRTSNEDLIRSKKITSRSFYSDPIDTTKVELVYDFLDELIRQISIANLDKQYIFLDKTGYTGRVDLSIQKQIMPDLNALKGVLRKNYGLNLVESEEMMDVLIVSEN